MSGSAPSRKGAPRLGAPITLVPTARHAERWDTGAAQVLGRWLRRLATEVTPGFAAASRATTLLATRAALDEIAPRHSGDPSIGSYLRRPPAERVIFASAVDRALRTLREWGLDARTLRETGTARGALSADLLSAVDATLSRVRRFDPSCAGAMLVAAQREGALDRLELPSRLDVRGLITPNGDQLDALEAIHRSIRARGGHGVTLVLPRLESSTIGKESAPHGAVDPMELVGARLEARLVDKAETLELEWEEPGRAVIERVVEARGTQAEARAAARAALDALAAGTPADQIVIIVPMGSDAFMDALRAALDEAGVAFSEPWGRPAERTPEAGALSSLIDMAAGRLRRDALVELLRTPGLHAGSWVTERDERAAERQALLLAHRLRDLPVIEDRTGHEIVAALRASFDRERDAWMPAAVERIAASIDALRSTPDRGTFLSALLDLAHRLRLGDPSAAELGAALRAEDAGDPSLALGAAAEGAVAVRAFRQSVEMVREAGEILELSRAPLDIAELSFEIEKSLESLSTAARGASGRAGAVRISDVREVCGLAHQVAIVTRLSVSGYLGSGTSSPWLDDATLERLPRARRPPSPREQIAVREAALAWAITTAKRVTLTFATADDDGRALDPPHAIATRALGDATRPREPAARVAVGASVLSARGEELMRLARGEQAAPDLVARVDVEIRRARFFADPGAVAGPFSGALPAAWRDALRERMGGDRPDRSISVSAIERAVACPFRVFSERVLRARRAEEVAEALSPRERGTLLHHALFAAFETERDLPPSVPLEGRLAAARVAIHAALETGQQHAPLRREAARRAADDALAVLEDELRGDRQLVYRMGERRFAHSASDPFGPLELGGDDGSVLYVEGQIDRIDASPDGKRARVVDYKTGKAPSAKAIGDTSFQLPLYATVARRLGAESVSGVYVSVSPGGFVEVTPKRDDKAVFDAAMLDAAATRAVRAVTRLWAGDVAPRPLHLRTCARCDARDVCRRPAVMPASEEETDDATQAKREPDEPRGDGS